MTLEGKTVEVSNPVTMVTEVKLHLLYVDFAVAITFQNF